MRPFIDCRRYALLLSQGGLEEAGAWTRLMARLHHLICPGCRRLTRELRRLTALVRLLAEPPPARVAALQARLLSGF